MSETTFKALVALFGLAFTLAFFVLVLPTFFESWDIVGAFAGGFVNPFSTGYALDTILCGAILTVWIVHERRAYKIRHGWVAIALCLVPGVATAFATYLLLRQHQLSAR